MALNKAPQSMLDLSAMQTVNVKDYGAIGDGISDDYSSFLNALIAVNSSGGGAVIVPPGTYLIGQPLLLKGYENTNLVGSGIGATVLTKNGAYAPLIRFYLGKNNSVSNLTIDCNSTSGRAIYIQDINSFIEHVEIVNCAGISITLGGGTSTVYGLDSEGRASNEAGFTTATFFPSRCRVLNCKIYNANGTAIFHIQMPYSEITSNYIELVFSEGILATKCDYSTITNNVLVNVNRGGAGNGGIYSNGSSFLKIFNNSIVGVQIDESTLNNRSIAAIRIRSIAAASSGNIISGNTIENSKIGVWLNDGDANNSTDNIITNNTFKTTGTAAGTGSAQYGDIWIGVAQNNNFVADNAKVNGNLIVTDLGANNTIFPEFEKPFVILALGQSNMAGNAQAVGGDYTVDPDVYLWDTDVSSGTCVFGTKFQRATFGVAPMNQNTSGTYWQLLAYQTAKNLRQRINKKIYVVQVARGGQKIEAFLSDSVLSTNSWSRGANQNLSLLMYPGLGTALSAVPGSPSKFDAVIFHQGESNEIDGADTYARKMIALIDELDSNGFTEKEQTIFCPGQICFSSANSHYDRHTWAMKRAQLERQNVKIVFSKGAELPSTSAVHFTGNGICEMGRRYADTLLGPENFNEFKEGQIVYGPDTGFGGWVSVGNVGNKLLVDRPAFLINGIENYLAYSKSSTRSFSFRERTSNVAKITTSKSHTLKSGQTISITCTADTSFSNAAAVITVIDAYNFTYANTGANVASTADSTGTITFDILGTGGYKNPGNLGIVLYLRKIVRVPQNSPVRIVYEIAVDESGGTVGSGFVDHRAAFYQFSSDFSDIGFVVSTPTSSPLYASSGRIVVTRTFGRPGVSCDTTLDANTEYVAIGFNAGVGSDDEPFYFNVIDIGYEELSDEIPDYSLLESDSNDAAAGPILDFYRNSASPAANDLIGRVLFRGEDSAGNSQDYAAIQSVINSPTSGAETGSIVFATTTGGTLTDQARVSSGGNLEIFGGGKIGYATGSGGTVTQLTSKATAVTINKSSGSIVTASDNLGNGGRVFFTVNNSKVEANDVIIAHRASGGTADGYEVLVMQVAAGSFGLEIINISGGSLSEAIVINFAVIKAVTA